MKIILSEVKEFKEIPGPYQKRLNDLHQNRINEFLTARMLLLREMQKLYKNVNLADLEEENYQQLKNFEEIRFSFSHTNDQVALLLSHKDEANYLGIDIEKRERKIPQGVQKYLNHEDEKDDVSIEKWTKKEAAYKYFSAALKKENFWLKKILIKGDYAFFEGSSSFIQTHTGSKYVISVATKEKFSLVFPHQQF